MDWSAIGSFLLNLATSLGLKLLEAIIILVVGLKLIGWLKKFLKNSPKLNKLDSGLRSFLVSFSSIVLYVLLIITIAMILGVPVTSFITILASCGVAVGLALQGSLSNFAGGIMILLFKPFKVGDFIEAAGETGTVTEITVVYTVLLTPDNKRITVPNGTLTNSVIENYSAEDLRRVDLTFTAAYDCDVEKVKAVIEQVIAVQPQALKEPAPFVRLSKHGDSALEYVARVWCKNADYWTVHFDITENVKKAFDDNNIAIPFPQMDVHIDK
ncbi:MAG: mechanosensitive ion channel family protein [Clostridia bacterium]|nr:mechanosensitive ion channel family protein [Clostridia bacterium]